MEASRHGFRFLVNFSSHNPDADGFLKSRGVFVLAMTQLSGRALGPAIPPVVPDANAANAANETHCVYIHVAY